MKLKQLVFRFLWVLILMLTLLVIWQWPLVNYGLMQLRGQLEVVRKAVPLEDFLALPTTTPEQKEKIKMIQEARTFAFDRLGILPSENYTNIFDQQGQPSMYVVTACAPYAFQPRMWHFPVVGSFPYKGFFEKDKALAEAKKIKEEEGLEVSVRTAGGWSTLGWFKDPVLSNMLNRSEGDLANLIIHELTHGTLFVKDSVTFNENLASFIGDQGALLFLEEKYGKGAVEAEAYAAKLADETIFKSFMLRAAQSLDSLYTSFASEADSLKLQMKQQKIAVIQTAFDTLNFQSTVYEGYFDDFTPNNTYFMSMLRYNGQKVLLEEEWLTNYQGDLAAYLAALKKKYPSM